MSKWTLFNVPLGQGLDTKRDEKQLPPGKLTTLENGVFPTPGAIRKRYGLTSFATGVLGGGRVTNGVALSAYNNELILFSSGSAYSWVGSANAWSYKGNVRSVATTTDQIYRNGFAQDHPDVAVTGSFELYAWEDSQQLVDGTGVGSNMTGRGVLCTVIDSVSRAVIMPATICTTSGSSPQCFLYSGSMWVGYGRGSDNGHWCARRIDPAAPSTLGSEISLVTDAMDSQHGVVAIPGPSRLSLVYNSYDTGSLNGAMRFAQFNTNNLLFLSRSFLTVNNARWTYSTSPVAACSDPSNNVWWITNSGSHGQTDLRQLFGGVVGPTGNPVLNPLVLCPITASIINLAIIAPTGSVATFYYELSGTTQPNFQSQLSTDISPILPHIGRGTFGIAQSPATSSLFARSVGLASKPFAYGGTHFLWTNFDSTQQSTYFLFDADGNIVSKANAGTGGPRAKRGSLSNVVEYPSGVFRSANLRRGPVLSESGSLFTNTGVSSTMLDFTTTSSSFSSVKLGNQLITAGGMLNSYDGLSFTEHGFHVFPEGLYASSSLTNGNVKSGTYSYIATFEWMDNFGGIHRSETSLPLVVQGPLTLTGTISINVPTLRLSAKSGRSIPQVGIYRTENNGDTFYKVTSAISPFYNSSSLDVVTFVDTHSDAELISRELLYTTGGELDNSPPVSARLITTYKNRVWLAGIEDPLMLRYSKVVAPDVPVSFSDFLFVRMDSAGGDISAIVGLQDSLIVFKEHGIHRIYPFSADSTPFGGGPDNTGVGGSWAQEPIASDVGCTNANSIVVADQGIFFESAKGIYLLGRDRSLTYVGAPVEGLNNLTITSANLVADQNQVRFTTNDGVALVYHYDVGEWGTFTNHQSVDAAVVDGDFMILRSNGTVAQELPGTYTDDNSHVPLTVETGWISPFGLQSYQRVRNATLLGEYEGPHLLNVYVGYDYSDAYVHTASFDPRAVNTSDGQNYQLRVPYPVQKCTATRIKFQDVLSGSAGNTLSVSSIVLETKPKTRSNRLGPMRVKPTN